MESRKPGPPPAGFDDDAPILSDDEIKELRPAREWFAQQGMPMPKLGRPPAEKTKQSVTIRIDGDVVDYFKASGPGWQTRMHEVLAREARKNSA